MGMPSSQLYLNGLVHGMHKVDILQLIIGMVVRSVEE